MPQLQASFPIRQDAGLPGGAAMSRYQSDSAPVQTNPVGFGEPVQRGPDQGGIAPFVAGGTFLGIARQKRGSLADRHEVGTVASYYTGASGVYVNAEGTPAQDAIARWNTVTKKFTSAAASGTVLECTGWTFDRGIIGSTGIAIIKRV